MPHVRELFAVSICEIKCLWILLAFDDHICSSTIRATLADRLLGGVRLCSASTAVPWWHCTTTWTSLCDELPTEPTLHNIALWLEVHWMYSMYSSSVARSMRQSYIASGGWFLSRFCVSLSWVRAALWWHLPWADPVRADVRDAQLLSAIRTARASIASFLPTLSGWIVLKPESETGSGSQTRSMGIGYIQSFDTASMGSLSLATLSSSLPSSIKRRWPGFIPQLGLITPPRHSLAKWAEVRRARRRRTNGV